jgi:hypothetical protein
MLQATNWSFDDKHHKKLLFVYVLLAFLVHCYRYGKWNNHQVLRLYGSS